MHHLKVFTYIKNGKSASPPDMNGKNRIFKTGSINGCDCAQILALIEAGKIESTPLITHCRKLEDIEEAYHLFEYKLGRVIKVAITPNYF